MMTKNEFEAKKQTLGIEGTGVTTTTTIDRNWKNKITGEVTFTIPAGSQVHVLFMPKTNAAVICVVYGDKVVTSATQLAHKWLRGFTKPPSIRTIEKRQFDGISRSVTGKKVEPDGYGPDGSPSWELVLGII